jgi:hypothetical protein
VYAVESTEKGGIASWITPCLMGAAVAISGEKIVQNHMPRSFRAALLLVPFWVVGAWAAPEDTLTLVNVGPGNVMGGVYTSPYGISVDGTTVPLICDDFTTDISFGESWQAIPTTFSAIQAGANPEGTPKFTPMDIQNYATVAVLAAELMALPDTNDQTISEELGEISYALWDVFDPTLLNSVNTGFGTLTGGELSAAQGYLAGAQALVAGATSGGVVTLSKISINGSPIEDMTIYTPDPRSAAQEFVTVTMAEPPSLSVLIVYLLLGGGSLLFFGRRRIFETTNG